jgi:hypothetical protein
MNPSVTRQRLSATLVLACCLLGPVGAHGQLPDNSLSAAALAVWGAISGAGLAAAYMDPSGEGWLVSDDAALPLGVAVGIGSALLVHSAGNDVAPSASRRPRLRVTAGLGGHFDLDYSLAYRRPLGDRSELETAILIVNDSWERVEVQTRCGGFFGCITGNFLTAYSYQQNVSVVVRGMRELVSNSPWNPTVAVGGGAGIIHVESDTNESRHAVIPLDVGVGIERGQRYRWTTTAGVRVTLGSAGPARIDNPTWYARIGLALGG